LTDPPNDKLLSVVKEHMVHSLIQIYATGMCSVKIHHRKKPI